MDLRLRLAMQDFRREESVENALRLAKEVMRANDGISDDLEIAGLLVVSSAHVDESDLDMLGAISFINYEYGWLLTTYDLSRLEEDLKENNPNIYNLLKLAKDNGCSWLRIDADGPTVPGFPTYEW